MQYSGQKQPISGNSDSVTPADKKFKLLDKPSSYSSSGRADVLSSSYRSSDTRKSDTLKRANWDNQSKAGFQISKFPKKENTGCSKPVSGRLQHLFSKLEKISNDQFIFKIISEGYKFFFLKSPRLSQA